MNSFASIVISTLVFETLAFFIQDSISLKECVGGYKSIVLMSHLEAIREVTEYKIEISRTYEFSLVQFGRAPKKFKRVDVQRGRPKKNKDTIVVVAK